MAEEQENPEPAAPAEPETPEAPSEGGNEGFKGMVFIAIAALVGAAAGAGGYLAAGFLGGPEQAQGQIELQATTDNQVQDALEGQSLTDYEYIEFPTITCNLNEPRMERYIRATIALAIKRDKKGEYKAAIQLIKNKQIELKDWLTSFLCGCTLDDVRGDTKLNRLRREILDRLNERLWPTGKPMIEHVLFQEFAIQ